jgi:putative radical SAM enzyme (TIGR03279 family)
MSYPTVLEVVPGSPAAVAGIEPGDELVAVNGVAPADIIEYQQLVDEPDLELVIQRGEAQWPIAIEKQAGAPLGLRLNASIFDRVQTCDNHCEFCFIYQLPPGMRKSLYLKDDDYRLSFLYGNFTTLTRFTELDLARTVEERLGPLYVSIHATDPEVRAQMLRNPRGATSLRWLRGLLDNGIEVHGQIVLLPTVNSGEVLSRTCAEILARYSGLSSVGIVPLGVSRYNKAESLVPHTRESASVDLDTIHFWQQVALERIGRRMFFASDELYLVAGREFPDEEAYEDFAQHENGIGMARTLYAEIDRLMHGTPVNAPLITGEWRSIPAAPAEGYRAQRIAAVDHPGPDAGPLVLVTGTYGAQVLEPVLDSLSQLTGRAVRVLAVSNDFFGGNTSVAGLLVGEDVRKALLADDLPAGAYLIPDVALQGDTFLDNMPLNAVAADLDVPVVPVEATAAGLLAGATS